MINPIDTVVIEVFSEMTLTEIASDAFDILKSDSRTMMRLEQISAKDLKLVEFDAEARVLQLKLP